MNVSNVQPTDLAPPQSVDAKRIQLQALLLKKSLEAQQTQAEELARPAEGKGQFLDIRV